MWTKDLTLNDHSGPAELGAIVKIAFGINVTVGARLGPLFPSTTVDGIGDWPPFRGTTRNPGADQLSPRRILPELLTSLLYIVSATHTPYGAERLRRRHAWVFFEEWLAAILRQ